MIFAMKSLWMMVEKYDFMIPNQGTDKKTTESSVINAETIQRYENCDLNMSNYTFDPALSCSDDEIEDVWCVSFGDIMSQLGGGKLFNTSCPYYLNRNHE